MDRRIFVSMLAVLVSWCGNAFPADVPARGTLVVDVKPFQSEVELKPKVEAQLKSGGLIGSGRRDQREIRQVDRIRRLPR